MGFHSLTASERFFDVNAEKQTIEEKFKPIRPYLSKTGPRYTINRINGDTKCLIFCVIALKNGFHVQSSFHDAFGGSGR